MPQRAPLVRFSVPTAVEGVELVSAFYPERHFPTHSHPEFVIGAVLAGAEMLEVGQRSYYVPAGTSLLLHPGEAHSNSSVAPQTLAYRVMYISPAVIEHWVPGLRFAEPVNRSHSLFQAVTRAHVALERSGDPQEQHSAFAALMGELAQSTAVGHVASADMPSEGVRRAKDFIDACFDSPFTLNDLAHVAGISRFHLVRAFKRATGLTPLAYRNQRRVEAARAFLRAGKGIAEIALELGFADQSHLTRQFQRIVGTSPARYREQ